MSFLLQLNYYKDEDGEYSDPQPTDLNNLKELIWSNWPNESHVEDLRVILIRNHHRSLILKSCKKNVFEVYYTEDEKKFYHKKSLIELIQVSSELFFDLKIDELKRSLNQRSKKRKSPINDFFINHNYKLTKARNLKELNWFFTMGLPLALIFLAIPIASMYKGTFDGLSAFFMVLLTLLGLFLWLPGLLLHRQYYMDNKNLKIMITRGSDTIRAEWNGRCKTYGKKDLVKATKVTYQDKALNVTFIATGPIWWEYGYMELEFKNGDVINLTNLIVDQLFILDKFLYDDVQKYRRRTTFPFIEHPTRIE